MFIRLTLINVNYYMKNIKKTKKMMARTHVVELLAHNVGINNKEITEQTGISSPTLRYWLSDPEFSDRVYKRYMEVAGMELPPVIKAMIEEAKLGNVQAARLILEHFGKLENKVKIQVESNFEKFMKSDNAEDADFFDINEDQIESLDQLSKSIGANNIILPDRDSSNNNPRQREQDEKRRLRRRTIKEEDKKSANDRYKIRKRAQAVNLDLLPPGRHTKSERDMWMKKLEEL